MSVVFGRLTQMGVVFDDENQVGELTEILTEYGNNVRIWENNGHTPNEITRKFGRPNLRPLVERSSTGWDENVIDFAERKKKKVGRNDPCPCGSGKKYKKCCLGKEE